MEYDNSKAKKTAKDPAEKVLRPKRPKKRRKLNQPLVDAGRSLVENKQHPALPVQDVLWAWPRVKPKKEQPPASDLIDTDKLPATLIDTPPAEVIYQCEELSEELSLAENSQFVAIPLSSHREYEVFLHSNPVVEIIEPETDIIPDTAILPETNFEPQLKLAGDVESQTSLLTDEKTIPIVEERTLDTINNVLLPENAVDIAADVQPETINPALISAADYGSNLPLGQKPIAGQETNIRQNMFRRLEGWWQQLRQRRLLTKYARPNQIYQAVPATPTVRPQSTFERRYESNFFRRIPNSRPSVAEFVKQLKDNALPPRAPRETPTIIEQVAASKPIESISKMISNLQPQLAEAGGSAVGSMNYLIKNTPNYPKHYQKSFMHAPGEGQVIGNNAAASENYHRPRLQVDEEKLMAANESTTWSNKSWDEIVALEAEKLKLTSKRNLANLNTAKDPLLSSAPVNNETMANPSPDMPPDLPPNREVQSSVWHRIEVDTKTGRAVDNPTLAYGEAFKQEQQPELQQPPEEATTASGQLAVSSSAQVGLPQSSVNTVADSQDIMTNNPAPTNQLESTIRVKRSPSTEFTDLWLWIILVVVILAIIFAISA